MLRQLNKRLTRVADNMAEFESQLSAYFIQGNYSCQIKNRDVYLEYQHDLTVDQAEEQAKTLLSLLEIPNYGDSAKPKNLLVDITGKEGKTSLHLHLSCHDERDLLATYICSQLLLSFQDLEEKMKQTA